MNRKFDKLILSDCDGVLCDWEWAFSIYMIDKGYTLTDDHKKTYSLQQHYADLSLVEAKQSIKLFNESAAIGFLPALRDSVFYVKRLYEEHGYRLRIITSLSLDKNAGKLREMNLRKLFGDAIESVVCLDTGADKNEALEPYRNSNLWWIEDKPENADVGHRIGLKTILVEHGHNMDHSTTYPVVKNWKEIYNIITA